MDYRTLLAALALLLNILVMPQDGAAQRGGMRRVYRPPFRPLPTRVTIPPGASDFLLRPAERNLYQNWYGSAVPLHTDRVRQLLPTNVSPETFERIVVETPSGEFGLNQAVRDGVLGRVGESGLINRLNAPLTVKIPPGAEAFSPRDLLLDQGILKDLGIYQGRINGEPNVTRVALETFRGTSDINYDDVFRALDDRYSLLIRNATTSREAFLYAQPTEGILRVTLGERTFSIPTGGGRNFNLAKTPQIRTALELERAAGRDVVVIGDAELITDVQHEEHLFRPRFPKLYLAHDIATAKLNLSTRATISRPQDVVAYVAGASGVDVIGSNQVVSALHNAGVDVRTEMGRPQASNLIVLAFHKGTDGEALKFVEDLGKSGAFNGKDLLVCSCAAPGDEVFTSRLISEYGAKTVTRFNGVVPVYGVSEVMNRFAERVSNLEAPQMIDDLFVDSVRDAFTGTNNLWMENTFLNLHNIMIRQVSLTRRTEPTVTGG